MNCINCGSALKKSLKGTPQPCKSPHFSTCVGPKTHESLSLALTLREAAVLRELAVDRGMSVQAIMRQALRVYQSQEVDRERGRETFTTGPEEIKCGCAYEVGKTRVQTNVCMTHQLDAHETVG